MTQTAVGPCLGLPGLTYQHAAGGGQEGPETAGVSFSQLRGLGSPRPPRRRSAVQRRRHRITDGASSLPARPQWQAAVSPLGPRSWTLPPTMRPEPPGPNRFPQAPLPSAPSWRGVGRRHADHSTKFKSQSCRPLALGPPVSYFSVLQEPELQNGNLIPSSLVSMTVRDPLSPDLFFKKKKKKDF